MQIHEQITPTLQCGHFDEKYVETLKGMYRHFALYDLLLTFHHMRQTNLFFES
jgi:hypothetical protein